MTIRSKCVSINQRFMNIGMHYGISVDVLNVGIKPNDRKGDNLEDALRKIDYNLSLIENRLVIPVVDDAVDLRFGVKPGESDPAKGLGLALIASLIAAIILIVMAIFLSSRRAEASHGPAGYVISDCCDGVNPHSGTSYRMVAMAFQPYRYTSVFETGTRDFEYILQWPQLEPTTQQLIRLARQRLAVVLTVDATGTTVKEAVRLSIDWQHTIRAIGMLCLFGGLMIAIAFWPYRKDGGN